MTEPSDSDGSGASAGLSWESGPAGRGLRGVFTTCRDVLIHPTESMHRTQLSGELWHAFAFYLGMMLAAIAVSSLISRLFAPDPEQLKQMVEAMTRAYPPEVADLAMKWVNAAARPSLLWTLTTSFILLTIYIFMVSALMHLFLMMVGAAGGGFEASFKALAYSHGATAPFLLIPFCGGMIKLLWLSVVLVVALVEWHRTSTARVLIGLTLPLIPMMCCFAAAMAMMVSAISGSYAGY